MYNQDDFQKVGDSVIDPLKRHYGVKFDAEMIDDYIADLRSYPAETLRKAMADLRRQEKRRPTLAHILEACENLRPSSATQYKNPDESFHCRGHAEEMHPNAAGEILTSPTGKLALQLGVARDLMVAYELTGRKEFDEAFVRKCKQGLDHAVAELMEVRNKQAVGDLGVLPALESLFEAFMQREKKLYQRYAA